MTTMRAYDPKEINLAWLIEDELRLLSKEGWHLVGFLLPIQKGPWNTGLVNFYWQRSKDWENL